MIITHAFLLFTAFFGLVMSRPQDVMFPDDNEGPSSFPLSTVETLDATSESVAATTPTAPASVAATTTTAPASVATTRIPPRDPSNRIIFIIPANCQCSFTRQYSPVCGTDGQTYGNIGVLECNRFCGKQVDIFLDRSCTSNNG